MRFIPTRAHAIIDYLFGIVLIAAPYLLGFANGGPEHWVPAAMGAAILLMSLLTDYEISIVKVVPMELHLGVDAAGGLLLLASPWLFGFADRVYWPHVIFGIAEVGVALMTQTRSSAHRLHA
jgi:hypothetical protein